jgi:hypothetical protein|tara:strand:+ start:483 stop:896 length:414 start_codon:yes stop_codon:yes gene_type:complete
MNRVQVVGPDQIHRLWSEVEDWLDKSLQTGSGECTIEQLKALLVRGAQVLLVATCEDDKLTGAMAVEFCNYPNERVMFINALGGKGVVNEQTFSQVEDWAKLQGATKVIAWAKESQAKLYKQRTGFINERYVVEKKI